MSEELQKLIKQAEVQQLQRKVEVLYNRNLALFSERFPTIHTLMAQHQPENVVLNVDPNGQLNLVDKQKREYIYNEIPSAFSKNQVEEFKRNAKVRRFRIEKNKEINARHLHIAQLNELIDEYRQTDIKRIHGTPKLLSNLIVSGVGLGYHLLELIKRFDIHNIFIYENCIDTFHASLHTIDWQPILDYFRNPHRSITFCIGVDPVKALAQVETSIQRIGLHTQIYSYIYRHTARQEEKAFIDTYMNEIQAYIGGLGYFDDEQIGLAHGYHNLKSQQAVFISDVTRHRKSRLLLIGNGPSLDNHKEYIERNIGNAVVMSCGTALGSLLRMGIKPDFHIEMERATLVHDFLTYGINKEDLKDIKLLCLHTVSPVTISSFSDVCYGIKPNDACSPLIHQYFAPQKVNELAFCNPTVTNCALSFAASMGFSDVHLIGVDLGMPVEGAHHSKNSLYYDILNHVKDSDKGRYSYGEAKEIYREGNFGGTVKTHSVLDGSRVSMERLLELIHQIFPKFRCVNSNNGIRIKYTETVKLDDIEDCKDFGKAKEISDIRKDHFHHYTNASFEEKPKEAILAHFYRVKEQLILSEKIETESDLFLELRRVYQAIGREHNEITHYLLRGSLNCFFGAIIENTLYCAATDDFKKRAALGAKRFNRFINDVYQRMQEEPFKIDDTRDPIIAQMRGEAKKA